MIERVFSKRVVSTLDVSGVMKNLIKSMSNLLLTQGTQPAQIQVAIETETKKMMSN